MADVLSYIHSKGVKHKDIKAENFLVFNMFKLKLCDFGLSKQHRSYSCKSSTIGGTLAFMAPEVRNGGGSTYASDIYSFAMTCVQVLTRRPPRLDRKCTQQIEASLDEVEIEQSELLLRLLLDCVREDPTSRPKAQDVHIRCMHILQANGCDPRNEGNVKYEDICALHNDMLETLHTDNILTEHENNIATASSNLVNIAQLNAEQAVEFLIDCGCIESLHERVAALGESVDGESLKAIKKVQTLQLLEGNQSELRALKLEGILQRVQQAVTHGITQDTMDRIQNKLADRYQKIRPIPITTSVGAIEEVVVTQTGRPNVQSDTIGHDVINVPGSGETEMTGPSVIIEVLY
jgi:serine/threonine protein kinase